MQYHGIKGKQLELQDGNVVLKVQDDTTLGKQGAYISKDDGATFEKLVDVSDTARLCKFEPNRYYNENDMIVENNIIYTRKAAGISAATLGVDIANWEAQVHLHTSGNRYVKFTGTTPTSVNLWTLSKLSYVEGDSALLDSNHLIAPVDGLYYINSCIIDRQVSASTTNYSLIRLNNDTEVTSNLQNFWKGKISYNQITNTSGGGTVTSIIHLNKGDYLSVSHFTTAEMVANTESSEFGLLAEDSSEGPLAEGEIVQYTSSVTSEIPIALENITNPTVLSTDGCITLPEDGTYYFNVDSLLSNANGKTSIARTYLRKNTANGAIMAHNMYTDAANLQICSLSGIISGSAGDKYYITHVKMAAQSSLTYDDIKKYVRIIKIKSTSIKLCSQDLYTEYLQNLPTGVTPMDYESWVKTIISQNQMRVKAKIVNQTRAKSGVISHKFTFAEGEQSMLSDNKFVAPFSGMYMINVPGLATSTIHASTDAGTTMITKGDYTLDSNLLGFSVANSTVTIPSVSTICWLNKGEEVSIWWNETASTSRTLLRNNYEAFVEFALIQSGHPYVNFPNLWTPEVEYDLGNGLYGKRVTGSVSASTKVQKDVSTTIDSGTASLIEYGGSWSPITTSTLKQSFTFSNIATAWAGVFVSNSASLTGITFRLYRDDGGMSGINYDFWIKYTK